MNFCQNCGKETTNAKFCSRSCSTSFNNRGVIRNSKTKKCKIDGCENFIQQNPRSVFCEKHYKEIGYKKTSEYIKSITLGEYKERESLKGKHPSWLYSGLRALNRVWNKHLKKKPCANCGYDKHVELCHIKAITDFDESALLGDINSEENNIQLCRNCHWELDNNLLTIEAITNGV